MTVLGRVFFLSLKRRRRHPAAWLSRPALSHRGRRSVWARSRRALPDRDLAAIRKGRVAG